MIKFNKNEFFLTYNLQQLFGNTKINFWTVVVGELGSLIFLWGRCGYGYFLLDLSFANY